MATRTKRWTFADTESLVQWMQDEYLSEITLEDLDPEPGHRTPSEVCFTWRLHGVGGGKTVPYRVLAKDVRLFAFDGARNEHAISVLRGADAGVHLIMELPGRLELACGSVVVTRGTEKPALRAKQRRPHTDYAYFVAQGDRVVSMADVLAALGAPSSVEVKALPPLPCEQWAEPMVAPRIGPMELVVDGNRWISLHCRLAKGQTGFYFSISRKSASEAEWHRAQEMPKHLGPATVMSAWEFVGTDADWMDLIGR